MTQAIQFSINRISASKISFDSFLAMCKRLNVNTIEIRNDLKGVEITDGTPPAAIKEAAAKAGVTIASINALYPFEQFNAERAQQALTLAKYAQASGAQALVLCPTNSWEDKRNPASRYADLVAALKGLKPILDDHGIIGLVEPLGFEECVLRRKSDAVKAIFDSGCEKHFKLVHDTFHHLLSGEDIFYPELTGLVHISGVEDRDLAINQMRDAHRVLVGDRDLLGNIRQLKIMLARGYKGIVSYEPFAAEVSEAADIENMLKTSMSYIESQVALS